MLVGFEPERDGFGGEEELELALAQPANRQ
jgi:hypothetical protein